LRSCDELRRAEIRQLDERRAAGALRQEQVRGFQIPNDDAVGVRFRHRFRCLEHIQYGFTDRQRTHAANVFFEVRAIDVLSNQIQRAVRFVSHIEDAGHVFRSNLRQRS